MKTINTNAVPFIFASYERLVNNTKRSFGEVLSRLSISDLLRVARKAYRLVRLSYALGPQRDAFSGVKHVPRGLTNSRPASI